MEQHSFVVEMDGQRIWVDPAGHGVALLEPSGATASCRRIQTVAGSLQGLFSMLEGVTGVKHV